MHRDLKPSNILVTAAVEVACSTRHAKLLDQDQAARRITRPGSRASPCTRALARGGAGRSLTLCPTSTRSALCCTNCLPIAPLRVERAARRLGRTILDAEPGRPSQARRIPRKRSRPPPACARADVDLDNILLKTLSKLPEQRYASVEALAQDLRRYLDGQPVQARAQSFGYRTRKYLRRHVVGLSIGFGVSTVLAVALAIVSWQASRAVQEASRAQAMQDFVIALFENSGNASSTRGVDVRALLDAGVARADTELAAQPQARAALLGLIARLARLGDDAEALDRSNRQQQLLQPLGAAAPASLLLDAAALRGTACRLLVPGTRLPVARSARCCRPRRPPPTARRCRRQNSSRNWAVATPSSRAMRSRAIFSAAPCSCGARTPTVARWSPRVRTTSPSWRRPNNA